jgi:hypothetical protein
MNETTLNAAFQDWWRESYGRPPGTHAVMTHIGFTMHILKLLELDDQGPRHDGRPDQAAES